MILKSKLLMYTCRSYDCGAQATIDHRVPAEVGEEAEGANTVFHRERAVCV